MTSHENNEFYKKKLKRYFEINNISLEYCDKIKDPKIILELLNNKIRKNYKYEDEYELLFLGNCYGKIRDIKQQRKNYLMAIEKGNLEAIFKTGLTYEQSSNYKKAETYYLMAIEKGNVKALEHLEKIYRSMTRKSIDKYFPIEGRENIQSICKIDDLRCVVLYLSLNKLNKNKLITDTLEHLLKNEDIDICVEEIYLYEKDVIDKELSYLEHNVAYIKGIHKIIISYIY